MPHFLELSTKIYLQYMMYYVMVSCAKGWYKPGVVYQRRLVKKEQVNGISASYGFLDNLF